MALTRMPQAARTLVGVGKLGCAATAVVCDPFATPMLAGQSMASRKPAEAQAAGELTTKAAALDWVRLQAQQ